MELDYLTSKTQFLSGKTAEELDFYRIRDEIAKNAVSDDGFEFLSRREPSSNAEKIAQLKDTSREWHQLINQFQKTVLSNFPPIKSYMPRLGVDGASLNQDEIFALGLFCNTQEKVKEEISFYSEKIQLPILAELNSMMNPLAQAGGMIFQILDQNGQLRDLPQLREIRKAIANLRKEIDNGIKKYTSSNEYSTALQSNVPVLRSGRELIAVRSDQKGRISGIIHEVSSTGSTLYVEPEEIVRANNELLQKENELEEEKRKIFTQLTMDLGLYREDFDQSRKVMIFMDITLAAAKWQNKVNGIFADDCAPDMPPKLLHSRHPLLGEKAVPIDINFLPEKKVLVITGPNTGGKTVTLKTVALFALLISFFRTVFTSLLVMISPLT